MSPLSSPVAGKVLLPESFLARLGDSDVSAVIGGRRPTRCKAGTVLFIEGERAGRVLVVLCGHVKIFSTSTEGREIVLAVRGPGEVLGELSSIDGAPRSASGAAMDEVELLSIPSDDFHALLSERPGIAATLLTTLVARLRDADRKRVEFGSQDTRTRLALRLLELTTSDGVTEGSQVRITLPLTQQELADWVGSSREAVTKALGSLRSRGLIETHRRKIVILDPARLRASFT